MQQRRRRLGRRRRGQRSLTVWTIEDVADRVTAQKKMAQDFTAKTGIKVNIVAVAEDQFDQAITSAAAADTLPDVVAALPLSALRTLESDDLLDTDTARRSSTTSARTRSRRAASSSPRTATSSSACPATAWAQLLVYRKDLFDKAGLDAPTTYDEIERPRRR